MTETVTTTMSNSNEDDNITEAELQRAMEQIKLEESMLHSHDTASSVPNAAEILAYRARNRKETMKRSKDIKSYKPMERRVRETTRTEVLDDAPWLKEDWNKVEDSMSKQQAEEEEAARKAAEEEAARQQEEAKLAAEKEEAARLAAEEEAAKAKKKSIADRYLAVAKKDEKEKIDVGSGYSADVKKWTPFKPQPTVETDPSVKPAEAVADTNLRPRDFLPMRGPPGGTPVRRATWVNPSCSSSIAFSDDEEEVSSPPERRRGSAKETTHAGYTTTTSTSTTPNSFHSPVQKISSRPKGKKVTLKPMEFLPMREKGSPSPVRKSPQRGVAADADEPQEQHHDTGDAVEPAHANPLSELHGPPLE